MVNGNNVNAMDGARIWFSLTWTQHLDANLQAASGGVAFGNRGFKTFMHEVGHALGLDHPGPYDGTAKYEDDAVFRQDTLRYTIMSYFGVDEDGSNTNWGERRYTGKDGLPETNDDGSVRMRPTESSSPMVMDILAIQALYGADLTTRTGNDTYGFGSAIPARPMYNFDINPIRFSQFTMLEGSIH